MAKVEIIKEGRLKRWSRLKSGVIKEEKEQQPETSLAKVEAREGYDSPDPNALPGGSAIRRGATVPAMPSLINEKVEVNGLEQISDEEETELQERDLTPEEQEAVGQLPPIESLTKDSDFTQFLSEKVPEFIRRRALRVLWRSDPILANLDGLNDYDENFRIIDTLISATEDTVYRVGKGHLKNEELEAESITEAEDPEKTVTKPVPDNQLPTEKKTAQNEAPDQEVQDDHAVADVAGSLNEDLEQKETEILRSSSIRKPKNSV